MQQRSVLIIGAGVGGLSAGCYALMNGYKVHIVEMHGVSGGVCASWNRGGYVFDGCIHNLAGSSASSALHQMWRELGVFPGRLSYAYPELVRVERPDGEPLVLHADLDQLRREWSRQSPRDAGAISELVEAARSLLDFDLMAMATAGPGERLASLAHLPALLKFGAVTLEHYAERFHDPFLRQAFPTLVYDWPQQTVAMLLVFMAGAHKGDLGWVIGGSAAFARAIERRFSALGGEIEHQARVEEILVEDDRAVGVRMADGSERRADTVISNAYGPTTIFKMLSGRYVSPSIRRYYSKSADRVEMGLHVALGVNRDLSVEPHAMVLPLDPPAVLAGEERSRLYVQTFGFDPSMAPPGKGVIKVLLGTSYGQWEELYRMPELYRQEKQRLVEGVITLLERRWPGIRRQVEMLDVATPMTTRRYTGNEIGFHAPASRMLLGLFGGCRLSPTLPGLKGFYMVGQWAGLPGVPFVAAMGRDVVRAMCRKDGRRFTATVTPETAAEILKREARAA